MIRRDEMTTLDNALALLLVTPHLKLEIADPDYGGWCLYDTSTYDGEPMPIYDTPTQALLDWYEEEIVKEQS